MTPPIVPPNPDMWAMIGGSAVGGFVLKTLWNYFFDSKKEERSDIKLSLARLNDTLNANTIALVKLEAQMENLWKLANQVPEVVKDVAIIGEKLRDMRSKEFISER